MILRPLRFELIDEQVWRLELVKKCYSSGTEKKRTDPSLACHRLQIFPSPSPVFVSSEPQHDFNVRALLSKGRPSHTTTEEPEHLQAQPTSQHNYFNTTVKCQRVVILRIHSVRISQHSSPTVATCCARAPLIVCLLLSISEPLL